MLDPFGQAFIIQGTVFVLGIERSISEEAAREEDWEHYSSQDTRKAIPREANGSLVKINTTRLLWEVI